MAIEIVDLPIENGGSFHSFLHGEFPLPNAVAPFPESSLSTWWEYHLAILEHQKHTLGKKTRYLGEP